MTIKDIKRGLFWSCVLALCCGIMISDIVFDIWGQETPLFAFILATSINMFVGHQIGTFYAKEVLSRIKR